MAVNLTDVARAAGVSYPTASRALGALPTKVGDKTIRHVKAVAAELGYRPHVAARALVSRHVPYVGMMFGTEDPSASLANLFGEEAQLLAALCKSLAAADYHLVLEGEWSVVGTVEDEAKARPPSLLRQHHVAGVLVMHYIWPGLYEAITRWNVPALGIYAEPVPGMPVVAVDRSYGASAAVEYLVRLGHRRIAFLPGSNQRPFLATPTRASEEARAAHAAGESVYIASKMRAKALGYASGMDMAGLPLFPGWNDQVPESHDKAIEIVLPRMIDAFTRPTAILTYDDDRAIKAIGYLQDRGLRVPQDVSVVSLQESYPSVAPVTSVVAPVEELATKAVDMLLRRVKGEPVEETQVFVRPRLVVHKSTAPPPA